MYCRPFVQEKGKSPQQGKSHNKNAGSFYSWRANVNFQTVVVAWQLVYTGMSLTSLDETIPQKISYALSVHEVVSTLT